MILARKTDDGLTSLVKRLDDLIVEHRSRGFKANVVFLGENPLQLKDQVADFAAASGTKWVPLTVAVDLPNGPPSFRLNPEVDYTVLIYRRVTVQTNHTANVGELTQERIDLIVEDTERTIRSN